jgi:hypothetical protein
VAKRGRKPRVTSLDGLVGQLQALDRQRQSVINQIRQATDRLLGGEGSAARGRRGRPVSAAAAGSAGTGLRKRKRRKMSREARAKIAAAQKARWARYRKENG